ncbi:zinc-ribbon domain-containing protein, partial [Ruminococcus sp.]
QQTYAQPQAQTAPQGEKFCPTCGGKVPAGNQFCPNCGNKIN